MLGQRRRRRTNIEPSLFQRVVFVGLLHLMSMIIFANAFLYNQFSIILLVLLWLAFLLVQNTVSSSPHLQKLHIYDCSCSTTADISVFVVVAAVVAPVFGGGVGAAAAVAAAAFVFAAAAAAAAAPQ